MQTLEIIKRNKNGILAIHHWETGWQYLLFQNIEKFNNRLNQIRARNKEIN